MYAGIADMRRHLQGALDALPSATSPMDKILAAVEGHLRHQLELSDYASATIRNAGQIPERLRARQLKEGLPMAGSGDVCSMKRASTVSSETIWTLGSLSCR